MDSQKRQRGISSPKEENLAAFPIGQGSDYFLLTVDLLDWGGDGHGLDFAGVQENGMWLSYMLFKSVASTDRFFELGGGGCHARSTDIFRLRSHGSGRELASWFSSSSTHQNKRRYLRIFLCCKERFIAILQLDLWQCLFEHRQPHEMEWSFFPREIVGTYSMESWIYDDQQDAEGRASGQQAGAWVKLRLRIEKDDLLDKGTMVEEEEEGGNGCLVEPSRRSIEERYQLHEQELEEMEEEEEEEEDSCQNLPNDVFGRRSFRLSIDLKSVRDLPHSQHVFLSYHSPHLVSSGALDRPILSTPVWVPAWMETPMSNSCCSWNFQGNYGELQQSVEEQPLIISVKAKEKGQSLGKVSVPLVELLQERPITYRSPVKGRLFKSYSACQRHLRQLSAQGHPKASNVFPIVMRIVDSYLPILPQNDEAEPHELVPSLRAVLVLEDLGPVEAADKVDVVTGDGVSFEKASNDDDDESGLLARASSSSSQQTTTGPVNLAVAMALVDLEKKKVEFEDWRHRTEVEWADSLRAKEQARMEELERSFSEKEQERKEVLKRAQEEFLRLKNELEKSLYEVELRERKVASQEEELQRKSARQAKDMENVSYQLQKETEFQQQLSHLKVCELEEKNARLQECFNQLQNEFAQYRSATTDQAELRRLQEEIFQWQRKYKEEKTAKDRALSEKEHYRAALQKTARALKKEQDRRFTSLREELEQLRLENQYRVDGGLPGELHVIKQALDALKSAPGAQSQHLHHKGHEPKRPHQQLPVNVQQTEPQGQEPAVGADYFNGLDSIETVLLHDAGDEAGHDPSFYHLLRERAELLSTGMYSESDPIIQELNRMLAKNWYDSKIKSGPAFERTM